MAQPSDLGAQALLAEVSAADGGHATALVLALPSEQSRAVLAALGPREVARLVLGARADRVPDLLDQIPGGLLPSVLAHLSIDGVIRLMPLLSLELASRVLHHLSPPVAAEVLLALPAHQRVALQESLPRPVASTYPRWVEQAIAQMAVRVSWFDPARATLVAEVFGRAVQVVAWDRAGTTFTPADLHAVLGDTDWRHVVALLVVTNAALDDHLGPALRDARQHGYVVDALAWQDERDDGMLKRLLVRLASEAPAPPA